MRTRLPYLAEIRKLWRGHGWLRIGGYGGEREGLGTRVFSVLQETSFHPHLDVYDSLYRPSNYLSRFTTFL